MKPPMHNTAYKVTTTRNAYGDYVSSTETELACHFREITYQVTNQSNEVIDADAMAWFEPDSGVVKGDILKIEDTYWRVERVTNARRLRNPEVQFIKTELLKYGSIS